MNDWFDRTLYSRLDNKREDVIILIMQRLHVEDLAGYVLQKEPWVRLNLPAIAEVEQDHPHRTEPELHPQGRRRSTRGARAARSARPTENRARQLQLFCPIPTVSYTAGGRNHPLGVVQSLR